MCKNYRSLNSPPFCFYSSRLWRENQVKEANL
nr:MAG TPA: hypothetical protein [Caudoviricetes sp.]